MTTAQIDVLRVAIREEKKRIRSATLMLKYAVKELLFLRKQAVKLKVKEVPGLVSLWSHGVMSWVMDKFNI